jgi:hypothetical protein
MQPAGWATSQKREAVHPQLIRFNVKKHAPGGLAINMIAVTDGSVTFNGVSAEDPLVQTVWSPNCRVNIPLTERTTFEGLIPFLDTRILPVHREFSV